MTLLRGRALTFAVALLLPPAVAAQERAQCAPDRVREGMLAYQQLRLDDAARLLRSALLAADSSGVGCPDQELALAFLGATELYRGREEEARSVFRRLALLRPRYQPDPAAFPPRVTDAYQRARGEVRAVEVVIPDRAEIRVGRDSLGVQLFATSSQPVMVALERVGSAQQRTLYLGPGRDSMVVGWDGRGADGQPAGPGRYLLTAVPLDTTGAVVRSARMPILLDHLGGVPLAPTAVAPTPGWSAAMSLGGALLGGAAVIALPQLFGDGDGATWRYIVAGAMAASGTAGLVWGSARRPEQGPRIRILRDRGLARDSGNAPAFR